MLIITSDTQTFSGTQKRTTRKLNMNDIFSTPALF